MILTELPSLKFPLKFGRYNTVPYLSKNLKQSISLAGDLAELQIVQILIKQLL